MVAPVKTKIWTHTNTSVAIGSGPPAQLVSGCAVQPWAADIRQEIWEIKNFLTTAPAAWTVVSSCGEVGGTGSYVSGVVDYWTTAANVWSTYLGEFSWIVLKQTGISAVDQGYQILLVVDGGGSGCLPQRIEMWVSPSAGFSGGTTSSRPTATDGTRLYDDYFTTGSSVTRGFSGFKSSDGECTRLYSSYSGGNISLWMFDRAEVPLNTAWSLPVVTAGLLSPSYASLHDAANVRTSWAERDAAYVYCTTEGQGGGALGRWTNRGDIANYFGEYICTRIGVAVLNNLYSSKAGFLGWIQDLWFTSDNLADGDYFPGDLSKQFVVFGDLLQPSENGENITID